jgi:hypothetical protein
LTINNAFFHQFPWKGTFFECNLVSYLFLEIFSFYRLFLSSFNGFHERSLHCKCNKKNKSTAIAHALWRIFWSLFVLYNFLLHNTGRKNSINKRLNGKLFIHKFKMIMFWNANCSASATRKCVVSHDSYNFLNLKFSVLIFLI